MLEVEINLVGVCNFQPSSFPGRRYKKLTKDLADYDRIISLWQVYTGVNSQKCSLTVCIHTTLCILFYRTFIGPYYLVQTFYHVLIWMHIVRSNFVSLIVRWNRCIPSVRTLTTTTTPTSITACACGNINIATKRVQVNYKILTSSCTHTQNNKELLDTSLELLTSTDELKFSSFILLSCVDIC